MGETSTNGHVKYKTTIGLNESQKCHRPLVFPDHPECPARIERILERLKATKILENCQVIKVRIKKG